LILVHCMKMVIRVFRKNAKKKAKANESKEKKKTAAQASEQTRPTSN